MQAAFAERLNDVEYVKRGNVPLRLDGFIPDLPGPHPAVIIVHGGGWKNGTKQTYVQPLFPLLTAANLAWFSIDYRLAPAARFPEMVKDVEDAVRWVRANSRSRRIDPTRHTAQNRVSGKWENSSEPLVPGRVLKPQMTLLPTQDI